MLKKIFTLCLIAIVFGCTETISIDDGFVRFSQAESQINLNESESTDIDIEIIPPAPVDSKIGIIISGAQEGEEFTTNPPSDGNEIILAVSENSSSTGFTISLISNNIETGNSQINFEIYFLGEGLNAELLGGRFFTLNIFKPREQLPDQFSIPYFENFSDCPAGENPPSGWQEEIIIQNNPGSAVWQCISGGVAINAFIPDSEDTSPAEAWLVSPTIKLDVAAPLLSFDIDRRFSPEDPDLTPYDVLISTDYDGSNFDNATWERFQPAFDAVTSNSPSEDGFSNSGNLDLSDFSNEDLTVVFVYKAGAPGTADATILRMTNFSISE